MGKVDCMRSRDVTQSRFLVIHYSITVVIILTTVSFFWLGFNARSGVRWEEFFHITRMLEVDLKLPDVHFCAFIFL